MIFPFISAPLAETMHQPDSVEAQLTLGIEIIELELLEQRVR